MNIWLVTSEFPPQFGGGIGTYAHNAARMFSQAGYHVTVLTQSARASDDLEGERLRVVRFVPRRVHLGAYVPPSTPPDKHPAFPFTCMSYWPALSYQFADEIVQCIQRYGRPDVIEVQDYNAIGYYLIQRKLVGEPPLADLPVVVHLHAPTFGVRRANKSPQYVFPEYWIGQMEKFCLLSADALLSPSRFMRDWLSEWDTGFPTAMVVPYPYDHPEPPPAQPTPGDVVYVGRLEIRKGVIPLVRACAKLWEQGQDFQLTLIGDDRHYDPLGMSVGQHLKQRFARHIATGQLCLTGPLPREEVLTRLSQAWCTVAPSLWENYPNTCIEAMSLGKVVIASTHGGQAEMVGDDEQAGFLFDWSNAGQFEQTLQHVLSLTPNQISEIGHHAAERIRRLTSFESVLPQRIVYYQKAIERSGQPRRYFPSLSIPSPVPLPQLDIAPGVSGLLSVVIPYYNLGQYLPETLTSIRNSDYPQMEIIIVNDGSDDAESLAVLRQVGDENHPGLRIISTDNQGLPSVRNTGAAHAKGEFLAFVDADDCVEPKFFSRAIAVLEAYGNVGFVYSWVRYFGEVSGIWPTWNTEFPYLLGHNMLCPIVVMRRGCFLVFGQNKPMMEYNFEDYDSWISIAANGYLGVSLPEPLVRYRVRAQSMYRQMTNEQALYLYELLTQTHSAKYKEYGVELFNLLNANGPGAGWISPANMTQAAQIELVLQIIRNSFIGRMGQKVAWSSLGQMIQRIVLRLAIAILAKKRY